MFISKFVAFWPSINFTLSRSYKVIILEDDIVAALNYEVVLNGLGVEVISVFKSAEDVMTCIKRQSPDFIIVDLHLNKNQSGFDFINKIQDFFIPIIIITGFPKETQTEEFVKLVSDTILLNQ